MNIHAQHRKRTKAEFLARPDSFSSHKVMEVLLFFADPRGDTNPLAHTLLDRFGSFAGVLDALPEELMKVPGVGEHTVALLKVVKEVARRYVQDRSGNGDVEIANDAASACALLRPYFFGARNERVCLLCMDAKGKSLGVRVISDGSVNSAAITVRNVVEAALSLNANRAVLAHNHVSGLALPSPEDKLTTVQVRQALEMVGVRLDDHLVLTDDDMVSLRLSGFDFSGNGL